MHVLLLAEDEAQDLAHEGLFDWQAVEEQLSLVRYGYFKTLAVKFSWLSEFFTHVAQSRSELNTYIALNYIKAHKMAQQRVCNRALPGEHLIYLGRYASTLAEMHLLTLQKRCNSNITRTLMHSSGASHQRE